MTIEQVKKGNEIIEELEFMQCNLERMKELRKGHASVNSEYIFSEFIDIEVAFNMEHFQKFLDVEIIRAEKAVNDLKDKLKSL